MQIKNNMERFVQDHLDQVLKLYPDCCSCDQCRRDIAALALNHLPPKYTSSKMGDIYTRLDSYSGQEKAEIIKEIAKAVQIVSGNPRHHME